MPPAARAGLRAQARRPEKPTAHRLRLGWRGLGRSRMGALLAAASTFGSATLAARLFSRGAATLADVSADGLALTGDGDLIAALVSERRSWLGGIRRRHAAIASRRGSASLGRLVAICLENRIFVLERGKPDAGAE